MKGPPVDLTWTTRAACAGVDPNVFFPDEDGGRSVGGRPKAAAVARQYCAGCPVLQQCRDTGDQLYSVGVWGGVVRWHRGARLARVDLLAGAR